MKRASASRIGSAFALVVAFACNIACAATPALIDLRRIDAVQGDGEAGKAKAAVCSACHGPAGVSPIPTFPHLAGQPAEYLYWQLVEFKHDARPDSPMTPQVATLDAAAMRDLAAWFASQPAPQATTTTAPVRGGELFRTGDPARGIPPCQGCHGADGGGHPLAATDANYRVYPKLRAQHAGYIAQRLKDFRDGKHTTSSADRIMSGVAHALDDDSIAVLSQWLEAGAPR